MVTEVTCYTFGLGDMIVCGTVALLVGAIAAMFIVCPRDVGG